MTSLPPESGQRPRRPADRSLIMFLATFAYAVLVCGFGYRFIRENLCLDPNSEYCPSQESTANDWAVVVLILLGGLGAVTVTAFLIGLPKTGLVYAVLTIALAVLLAQLEWTRDAFRPDPPVYENELDPNQCIPRSGGGSECPGG